MVASGRAKRDRLQGHQQQTLDEKGRIPIPAKFLTRFLELCDPPEEGRGIKVVIAASLAGNIGIYPPAVFDQLVELFDAESLENEELIMVRKTLLNSYDEQYLDKQNRFRVSSLLAMTVGLVDSADALEGEGKPSESDELARKVVIVGSDNYLELMGVKAFGASMKGIVDHRKELFGAAAKSKGLLGFLAGEFGHGSRAGDGSRGPGGAASR